jgi:hypothetical protein
MENREEVLRQLAKYIWWQPPEETLQNESRLIAQVMNIGTWEDSCLLERVIGEEGMINALRLAQPGWFTPRKWYYWHYYLGIAKRENDVPEMPTRKFL